MTGQAADPEPIQGERYGIMGEVQRFVNKEAELEACAARLWRENKRLRAALTELLEVPDKKRPARVWQDALKGGA